MSTKSEHNNQLTSVVNYDTKKMIFSEPQNGSVPNTPITFKRVMISTRNKDGTVGDLILPTEECFSFGVSTNVNLETKKDNGHVLPICLWSRDGATELEKAWTNTFDKIVERCKSYILEHKEDLEKYDLTDADLKRLNPLYWKKEKGKIIEGQGPTLYAKLIESKKSNKILSMFFDYNNEPLDPLSLSGKYCYVKAAVKIESIFVGKNIALQVKLYEASVRLMDGGMKPLMPRPKNTGRLIDGPSGGGGVDDLDEFVDSLVADNHGGSLHNSEDEEQEKKEKAPVVRKVAKKVVKKN